MKKQSFTTNNYRTLYLCISVQILSIKFKKQVSNQKPQDIVTWQTGQLASYWMWAVAPSVGSLCRWEEWHSCPPLVLLHLLNWDNREGNTRLYIINIYIIQYSYISTLYIIHCYSNGDILFLNILLIWRKSNEESYSHLHHLHFR